MNSRFLTNVALSVLGGFIVVASMVWSPTTFHWLMLGGGIGAVLLSAALVITRRGVAQRSLDGIIGVLGAWTIVASLVSRAALSPGWASHPARRSSAWRSSV